MPKPSQTGNLFKKPFSNSANQPDQSNTTNGAGNDQGQHGTAPGTNGPPPSPQPSPNPHPRNTGGLGNFKPASGPPSGNLTPPMQPQGPASFTGMPQHQPSHPNHMPPSHPGPQNFNGPNQGGNNWSTPRPGPQGPQSFAQGAQNFNGPGAQGPQSFNGPNQSGNSWSASPPAQGPSWGPAGPSPQRITDSLNNGPGMGPGPNMPGPGMANMGTMGPQAFQRPSQPLQAGGPYSPSPHKPAKRNLLQRIRARYQRLPRRAKIVLIVLAVSLLLPTLLGIIEGINTYTIYNQARSGLNHLNAVQAIMAEKDPKTGSSIIFDANKLSRAQVEVDAATADFTQLRDRLNNDGLFGLLGGVLPQQITTARALGNIAVEGMEIAQQGIKSAQAIVPTLEDPTLKDETKPLANQAMLDQGRVIIDMALPRIKNIERYAREVQIDSLPLSESQRNMLGTVLTLLPEMVDEAEMAQEFLATKSLDWLIGVDQPRNFLVQTQDRAELRPTGGFTGQFGILTLNGGRMQPPDLKNIGLYEKHVEFAEEQHPIYLNHISGNTPPEQFDWWPIPNFGMRDSNVSADFPTSAKLALGIFNEYYDIEFPKADGLIVFSPFMIAQMLRVTGPITLEKYNETITADNLEEKIHYYQLDNAGVWKIINTEGMKHEQYEEARKVFTKKLSEELVKRVKSISPEMMVNLLPAILQGMRTRDLQVYFTHQPTQDLITKYGSAATMDRSTDKDSTFIVHANVSVSKASQYVRTYVHDTVTLDEKGGATHTMTMRFAYTQIGQVYGLDTYFDYLRIYVPENSQLLGGNGFSQLDQPHCSESDLGVPCEADVFSDGTMICPTNSDQNYYPNLDQAGYPYNGFTKPGPPTNMNSDEPGRKMFGGWVQMPKNCNLTLTLSWYVPDVVKEDAYNLLFQRQAGTFPIVDMTILPTPGNCGQLKTGGLHFNDVLGGEDKLFSVPVKQAGKTGEGSCYPQMKV